MSLFKRDKEKDCAEDPCVSCGGKEVECEECDGCDECFMWENGERVFYDADLDSPPWYDDDDEEDDEGDIRVVKVIDADHIVLGAIGAFIGSAIAIKLFGGK